MVSEVHYGVIFGSLRVRLWRIVRIETMPEIVGDWSLPGDYSAATFDCREDCMPKGAERVPVPVQLTETDDPQLANIIPDVNGLFVLFGLRTTARSPRWNRLAAA